MQHYPVPVQKDEDPINYIPTQILSEFFKVNRGRRDCIQELNQERRAQFGVV
jgi:hypothetical protein